MAKNFTICQKLMAGAGTLVAATLLGTVYSAVVMRELTSVFSTTAEAHEFENAVSTASEMLGLERAMALHSIFDHREEVERYKQKFLRISEPLEAHLREISGTALSAESRTTMGIVRNAEAAWKTAHGDFLRLLAEQKVDLAENLLKDRIAPIAEKIQTAANERSESTQKALVEARTTAEMKSRLSAILLICLCCCIGGAVLAQTRSVTRKLRTLSEELSESADQMANSAGTVSTVSQSTAQGASEQAASVEETSASAEEITSMTRKNAESAKAMADYMNETEKLVGVANDNSSAMTASMGQISASSEKVSKIIKVIDGIAFQTNILALNAAVEAARAGDAGMGFAVVADEVRNLAQRSAQAASDTAALIEESLACSKEGCERLEHVNQAIHSITQSAAKIKTLVDEVNFGSQEEARGMDQIARAVAQIDKVTQQTAANAQESAAAGTELTAEAKALRALVSGLRQMVYGDAGSHDRREASRGDARRART